MIKKIYKIFQVLTPKNDKLAHFFFGFIWAIFSIAPYVVSKNVLWLFVPSVVVAGAKEFFDYRGNGKAELLDFVYTIIPSIVLTLIVLFL